MTQDDLDLVARFCDGVTHHYDEDRALIRRLLDEHASLERDLAELRGAVRGFDACRLSLGDLLALLPAEPPKEASDGK